MGKKVIGLVSSCKECPNRAYYSAGIYECTKVDARLPYNEEDKIPTWCPLSDYPASAIVDRDNTIRELRGQLDAIRDVSVIRDAADALQIYTGHDYALNIRRKFGERWWEPIKRIEAGLRKMIAGSN
jgi:hypothetical protein